MSQNLVRPQRGPKLLWPFTTVAAVLSWEVAYQDGGHQPWHASPCDTGELYARSVLGFSSLRVDSCEASGDQARVQVSHPGLRPGLWTVTTIHLRRIGANPGGWVVVQ